MIYPSLKAELAFFFPHVSRAQRLAPARTRTQVIRLGAQYVALACPRYSWPRILKVAPCTVVRSYIQFFSAWWVTTILYNYGATLCELRYDQRNSQRYHQSYNHRYHGGIWLHLLHTNRHLPPGSPTLRRMRQVATPSLPHWCWQGHVWIGSKDRPGAGVTRTTLTSPHVVSKNYW